MSPCYIGVGDFSLILDTQLPSPQRPQSGNRPWQGMREEGREEGRQVGIGVVCLQLTRPQLSLMFSCKLRHTLTNTHAFGYCILVEVCSQVNNLLSAHNQRDNKTQLDVHGTWLPQATVREQQKGKQRHRKHQQTHTHAHKH